MATTIRPAQDALRIGASTLLASGIFALAVPILTRLYTPEHFGVYGRYAALLSVLGTIVSLRIEAGIPVAKTSEVAADLTRIGYVAVAASALGWPVILWAASAGRPGLAAAFAVPLLALSIGIAAQGSLQIAMHVAVREARFRAIGVSKIAQSTTQVLLQAAGSVALGGAGLIAGDIAGRVAGVLALFRSQDLTALQSSARPLGESLREFSYLPRHIAPATFLTMMASQLPLFAIPILFGEHLAGEYFLAYRLTYLPAALFAAGVAPVLLGRLGALEGDAIGQELAVKSAAVHLTAVGLSIYALGWLTVGHLPALLGHEWQSTGSIARMLIPAAAAAAIAGPLSSIMIVKARGVETVLFATLDVLVKVACLAVGAWFGSFSFAVALLGSSGAVLCCISMIRFLNAARARPAQDSTADGLSVQGFLNERT